MTGYFTRATSLIRIGPDKQDFHLQFRSRQTMLWCLASPKGRLYMRSCLLVHASFIAAQPAGSYSTKYNATLRRWLIFVGGGRKLKRATDPSGHSVSS